MSAPSDAATARSARALLVAAGFALLGVELVHIDRALQDDAFISFLYARNWAEGAGFVYNAGLAPVEGYTNFLWTALIGLGLELGIDPAGLSRGLGMLCSLALLGLTALCGRRCGAPASVAAAGALVLATRRSVALEAVGGLETTLFALLVLGAFLTRPGLRAQGAAGPAAELGAGALHGLAALTRPEGWLVYGLLELWELGRALRERRQAAWFGRALLRFLPFAALAGAHLAWRWSFYGELVPNTFHAKVSGGAARLGSGVEYVAICVACFGPALALLPYLALSRVGRRALVPNATFAAALYLASAHVLYVIAVGGDFKPTSRFLQLVLPLWCALAGATTFALLARVVPEERAARRLALQALLVLGALGIASDHYLNEAYGDRRLRNRQLEAAGRFYDELLPGDAVIACSNAGALPYFAQRTTIDMLGLNDKHIARREVGSLSANFTGHLKGDGAYVLEQAPHAISFLRMDVGSLPFAEAPDPWASASQLAFGTSERELAAAPRFRRRYELKSFLLSAELGYLNVFMRRDLALRSDD